MTCMKLAHKLSTLFFVVFLVAPVLAQENGGSVLVLHSYHRGLEWTDSIMRGIETEFARRAIPPEIHVEYMDTKRYLPATVFPTLHNLYVKKYSKSQPGLIIVSDDNAYEFILTFQEELFPGVPVVFCGVNFFDPARIAGRKGITGIVEGFDILGTLETAVYLHPETERIFVVNDTTTTGQANKKLLSSIIPQLSENIDFSFLEELSMEELQGELKTLPPNSLVLLLSFNRDRTGRTYTYQEAIKQIAPHTKVPMYGVWDFYLGKGIVGGKLTRGQDHGGAAARMGLRILHGEPADNIPVEREGVNTFMFDYPLLRKVGINIEQLPPGSIIANEPDSFYRQNRGVVLSGGTVIAALTLLTLFLMHNITKRKRAEEKLRESEETLVKHRDHLELLVEDRTFKLKEAQAELIQGERLATLGRLTATVSHELRNPLGTVRNTIFTLGEELNDRLSPRTKRMMALGERNIVRCVNIIEDLLDYTRVKPLDLTETNIDHWLNNLVAEYDFPNDVEYELSLSCAEKVHVDKEKLRQVMVNLIANAVDAVQDEEAKWKHILMSTSFHNDEYEIRIQDTGIGMSEETMKEIFEPLFSTKGFGVGLGMVIVKNIIEQHNGVINTESQKGDGTTVTLRLPTNLPKV